MKPWHQAATKGPNKPHSFRNASNQVVLGSCEDWVTGLEQDRENTNSHGHAKLGLADDEIIQHISQLALMSFSTSSASLIVLVKFSLPVFVMRMLSSILDPLAGAVRTPSDADSPHTADIPVFLQGCSVDIL